MTTYRDHQVPIDLYGKDLDHFLDEYIAKHRNNFREWYMPIKLGKHAIPCKTYPNFQDRPETLNDNTAGQQKWDFVIKDNLPDLSGKFVCDIGCNAGVFSLNLADAGASIVNGYDRAKGVIQPNNPHLGAQDVAEQAYFVRNLYEAYYHKRYTNVTFTSTDLMTLDFKNFHERYNMFFSCCTLYHFGAARMEEIIRDISQIPTVFLQTNHGHGGSLGQVSHTDFHVYLLKKYGYRIDRVGSPPGCIQPVVLASKEKCNA